MIDLTKIMRFLTATDERTWIGHGVQGLLFGFLFGLTGYGHGALVTLGAFGHREADDYFVGGGDARDGFMDLWSALAGAALGELIVLVVT